MATILNQTDVSVSYLVGLAPEAVFPITFAHPGRIADLDVRVAGVRVLAFTIFEDQVILADPAVNAAVKITLDAVIERVSSLPDAGRVTLGSLNAELDRVYAILRQLGGLTFEDVLLDASRLDAIEQAQAGAEARVSTLESARVSDGLAAASRFVAVEASVVSAQTDAATGAALAATASAAVTSLQAAVAVTNGATASRLDVVESQYNSVIAAVAALDGNFDVVQSTIDAAVLVESAARTTAVDALAARTTTVEASLVTISGDVSGLASDAATVTARINAAVATEATTRTTADNALAVRATTIEANYRTAAQVDATALSRANEARDAAIVSANAAVSAEATTRAAADTAEASARMTLTSQYNGTKATVSTLSTTTAGLTSREASHRIVVDAGVPGGLAIKSTANNSRIELNAMEVLLNGTALTDLLGAGSVTRPYAVTTSGMNKTLFTISMARAGYITVSVAVTVTARPDGDPSNVSHVDVIIKIDGVQVSIGSVISFTGSNSRENSYTLVGQRAVGAGSRIVRIETTTGASLTTAINATAIGVFA